MANLSKTLPMRIILALILITSFSCRSNSGYLKVHYLEYNDCQNLKDIRKVEYRRSKISSINDENFIISMILDSTLDYKSNKTVYIPKLIDTIINSSSNDLKVDTTIVNSTTEEIYQLDWSRTKRFIQYYKAIDKIDSTNEFNYFDKHSYRVNGKNYIVYCIGHIGFGKDGDHLFYCNKDFGMLAEFSIDWGILLTIDSMEKSNQAALNELKLLLLSDKSYFPIPDSLKVNRIRIPRNGNYFNSKLSRILKK